MGITHLLNMARQRAELVRDYFEPQLADLGLSMAEIEKQDFDELNQSLDKINTAISHPESFGALKVKFTTDGGMIIGSSKQEGYFPINVLPILLERKSLILKRLKELGETKKIESLQGLVASVPDPGLRDQIKGEVSRLAQQSSRLVEQESGVAQAQAEQFALRDAAVAKLQAELFERRLRALTGFLARESMATYVGAFLLIVLTTVHVVAMFSAGVQTSEIVNNSYLLILGYFFGQSVARTASGEAGGKEAS